MFTHQVCRGFSERKGHSILSIACLILIFLVTSLPILTQQVFSKSAMVSGVAFGSLTEARAKAANGAKVLWARTDVDFSSGFQTSYSVANKYKINLIGILDYSLLNWNAGFTLDDWKKAVAKAQSTYPMIKVWEIWNEPTLKKYQLGYMDGTPQHYYDLLKIAHQTLKAKDRSAIVLGLGGAQLGFYKDIPFAQGVFSLGGAAYMDAISIHAYPGDLNIGKSWEYYKDLWTKELTQYKTFGKPFWVTETGLQSNQLTESDQVTYLKNSYAFFTQQGASAFIWFQLSDYVESSGTARTWGLLRTDLTPKLSYSVFKGLVG